MIEKTKTLTFEFASIFDKKQQQFYIKITESFQYIIYKNNQSYEQEYINCN